MQTLTGSISGQTYRHSLSFSLQHAYTSFAFQVAEKEPQTNAGCVGRGPCNITKGKNCILFPPTRLCYGIVAAARKSSGAIWSPNIC